MLGLRSFKIDTNFLKQTNSSEIKIYRDFENVHKF